MRVKRGKTAHRRHKKYLALAKGYRAGRRVLYRTARETVERALCFAYRDRRHKPYGDDAFPDHQFGCVEVRPQGFH